MDGNTVPIVFGFHIIGGAIAAKTTSTLVQLFFLSICFVIWFELEMLRQRMKKEFRQNNWLASRELVVKFRQQYELIVDLVDVANKMLGKLEIGLRGIL